MKKVEFLVSLVLTVVAVVRGEILLGEPGLHFNQNAEYASSYNNYQPRDYHFNYAVSDPHTGDHKSQWEVKEKGVVRGAYSLLEPDGTTRIVEYVADDHGFRAIVKKLGTSLHPESVEVHGIPSPSLEVAAVPEIQTFSTYDGHVDNYANVLGTTVQHVQPASYLQPIEIPQNVELRVNQHQPIIAQPQHVLAAQPIVQPQPVLSAVPVAQPQAIPIATQPLQSSYQNIEQSYQAQPVLQQQNLEAIQAYQSQPVLQQQNVEAIQSYQAQPILQHQVQSYQAQPIVQHQNVAEVQSYQSQPVLQQQNVEAIQSYQAQPVLQHQAAYQNIQPLQSYQAQPIQSYQAQPVQSYQSQPILQQHIQPAVLSQPIQAYPQASGLLENAAQSISNHQQLPSTSQYLQNIPQQIVQPTVQTSSQIHGLTGNPEDDTRYSNSAYQYTIPYGDYQGEYSQRISRKVSSPPIKRIQQRFLISVPN